MQIFPSNDSFFNNYRKKKSQLVYTRLVADLETPVAAMLKIGSEEKYSFLLESIEGGANRGRYSIIGLKPDIIWNAYSGDKSYSVQKWNENSQSFSHDVKFHDDPFSYMRELLQKSRLDIPEELPPMSAGIFGYISYDMVRLIEKLPEPNKDELNLPDAVLVRPTIIIIFDSVKDEMQITAPVYHDDAISADTAYRYAKKNLNYVIEKLNSPINHPQNIFSKSTSCDFKTKTGKDEFCDIVDKAVEYIKAGDIFQVVPSMRFETEFKNSPFAFYRSLRRINPSPYLFYLNFDSFSLIGSSPEILVKVKDGKVTLRPIAGTRPRGADKQEDKQLKESLLSDPKELAEHLMLLDLGRNDVGRVSKINTVEVTDSFFIEYYSQVMHIVSNVEGQIKDGMDVVDALCASLPAGTVSGAPKIRAMEIIDELEKAKRGPFYGCVGYFTPDGNMDSCIILRTALIKDDKLYIQAGAGVVYDSIGENEYQECINKAKALFKAAEECEIFES